jgi:hypothetical protein
MAEVNTASFIVSIHKTNINFFMSNVSMHLDKIKIEPHKETDDTQQFIMTIKELGELFQFSVQLGYRLRQHEEARLQKLN